MFIVYSNTKKVAPVAVVKVAKCNGLGSRCIKGREFELAGAEPHAQYPPSLMTKKKKNTKKVGF